MTTQEVAQSVPDLIALADRCEQAKGPDRELDAAIEAAVPSPASEAPSWVPFYTAAIDTAMALVPDGFYTAHEALICGDGSRFVQADVWAGERPKLAGGEASSIPLALCAAALRARAASSGSAPNASSIRVVERDL